MSKEPIACLAADLA